MSKKSINQQTNIITFLRAYVTGSLLVSKNWNHRSWRKTQTEKKRHWSNSTCSPKRPKKKKKHTLVFKTQAIPPSVDYVRGRRQCLPGPSPRDTELPQSSENTRCSHLLNTCHLSVQSASLGLLESSLQLHDSIRESKLKAPWCPVKQLPGVTELASRSTPVPGLSHSP